MLKNPLVEIVKFIWSIGLAILGLLVFSFVLDLIAWVVSGGWTDVYGDLRAGSWPVVTGTVSRIFLTPLSYTIALLIGLGGIARMILWRHTPRWMAFLSK